jgi:ATP-dependent helicase HepA
LVNFEVRNLSVTEFAIGQRWVSNSEAELGLGIIKELTGRRVEIIFPASGEQRTYAVDIAPLSRVHYPVGDRVSTNEDISFIITERHDFNGCYVYQGSDDDGNEISIHEMDLNSHVQFSQPQDRLFAGQIDKNSQFDLRIDALSHQHRLQQSSVFGLMGARVQLLPHQLYIAHQVSTRHAPRVLLADEVGLGKTIEAGLIIHQQIITGRSDRVLIVVPDSLIHQWLVEMLRRFNLSFTIMDAERYEGQLETDNTNPFETAQLVLCSLSTLINHPKMYASAHECDWDLMIVDEAHHLQWQPDDVSAEYAAIEQLAGHIPGLLLLTATPEQLGIESHFARLRLLDPDRYHDLNAFRLEEDNYKPVSDLVTALLNDDAEQHLDELVPQLNKYLGEQGNELHTTDDFESTRQQIVSALLDRHGTGRILYRNTRDVVEGFPKRILHTYPLEAPELYSTQIQHADINQSIRAEKLLGEKWLEIDSRVTWLSDWLSDNKKEKVLVICAHASTAQDLEQYLRISKGVRSSVFHEGLSLIHRDRAAAYFSDEEEGAQVMICSEIGSEGRNFQFSHHLVLFDLPLNPDLLEQRIGRLDRIGQQHDVNLHVPYYKDSPQAVLLKWYHDGMDAFERVFPAGSVIKSNLGEMLNECLVDIDNSSKINELLSKTQELTRDTLNKLQEGRDRLLELNSCNRDVANQIVEELEESARSYELSQFMDNVFDEYGVEQQTHSLDSIILEPGNHMLQHHFPGLPEDGITATYKRHRALVREDMAFLSWEHPMVLGSLDMIINSDFGNSAFCTLESDALQAGTLLVEAIFVMQCSAPKALQVGRYLNQSYLRVVVDQKGRDHTELFDKAEFSASAGRIPKATAQELVRHAREQIVTLVDQAKKSIRPVQQAMIDEAQMTMQAHFDNEIERLTELAQVNPNIRQEELDYLKESKLVLGELINAAQLKLDAIRVAIVTETK